MLRKTIFIIYVVFSIFLILSGCGTSSQTTTTTPQAPKTSAPDNAKIESKEKGYIFQIDSQVVYLNWTKDKENKIVGQMQITNLTSTGIKSINHSFTGVIDDPKISITITGSLLTDSWAGKVFTGTLEGSDKVTIVFPSTNGTMNPVTFTTGTVADFNNKVANLNQSYTKLQAEKKAEDQATEQLANQQNIIKSLSSIDKKIKVDTEALARLTFADILNDYDSTLKQMQQSYSKLKADANVRPFTSYQLGTVQYDLGTLQYHIGSFEYLDGTMKVRNTDLQYYIKNIQEDINKYNTLWTNYQTMGGQGSPITSDQKTSSIGDAHNQINKANDLYKTAQLQADNYYKKAKDLFNTAEAFVKGLKAND